MEILLSEPPPIARAMGRTPRIVASDVMRMGLNLLVAASITASNAGNSFSL